MMGYGGVWAEVLKYLGFYVASTSFYLFILLLFLIKPQPSITLQVVEESNAL